jgi:hypothetical protein
VCLFLILYWCSAFAESRDGPSILGPNSRNSRFGRINSRLGGCKFPLRATTGICRQPVDLLESFLPRNGTFVGKSRKFPVQREKLGIRPRQRNKMIRAGPMATRRLASGCPPRAMPWAAGQPTSAGRVWLHGTASRFRRAGAAARPGPSARRSAGARRRSGDRPRPVRRSCPPSTSARRGSAGS